MGNDSGILSRLDERSVWTLDWLKRIDRRLEEGDARFEKNETNTREMAVRLAEIEKRLPVRKDHMPALEKAVKILLPYAIAAGVLAITGSIEKTLQVLAALGGK